MRDNCLVVNVVVSILRRLSFSSDDQSQTRLNKQVSAADAAKFLCK